MPPARRRPENPSFNASPVQIAMAPRGTGLRGRSHWCGLRNAGRKSAPMGTKGVPAALASTCVPDRVKRRGPRPVGFDDAGTRILTMPGGGHNWAGTGQEGVADTHCGTQIVGSKSQIVRRTIQESGAAEGVDAQVAVDRLEVILPWRIATWNQN